MASTLSYQPSPELGSFIEEQVDLGFYTNQSEVINVALRLLQQHSAKTDLVELRKLVAEGENSGEAKPWKADEFLAKMRSKYVNN